MAVALGYTLQAEARGSYDRNSRTRDDRPKKKLHRKGGNWVVAALESPLGLVPLVGALGGDGGGGGGITQVPNVELDLQYAMLSHPHTRWPLATSVAKGAPPPLLRM